MKCFNFVGILVICVLISALVAQNTADSSVIQNPVKGVSMSRPLLIVGASALVPGSGQFYTRHYLKGGTFLALEAITASSALFWDQAARNRVAEYHAILNNISIDDSASVLAEIYERAHDKKHQALTAEFKRYNALTWMTGAYLYNLLDAFETTGLYKDNEKRNPRVAFGLSAIPVPGLGQIYNGAYSKAGLFMMTQVSLGVLAWNNHRLMKDAEANFVRINDTTVTLPSMKDNYSDDWNGKRQVALTNRNMYLWYSIFAYVIGMLDAVVDAHLHDYHERMKIEPDLVPHDKGAGLQLNVNF